MAGLTSCPNQPLMFASKVAGFTQALRMGCAELNRQLRGNRNYCANQHIETLRGMWSDITDFLKTNVQGAPIEDLKWMCRHLLLLQSTE